MTVENISWQTITTIAAVALCGFSAFNSWYTTRKNIRTMRSEKNEPLNKIHERLATDKARLDNHENLINNLQKDAKDTREGLNAIGKGVIVLLQKDESKTKQASDQINEWVWNSRK